MIILDVSKINKDEVEKIISEEKYNTLKSLSSSLVSGKLKSFDIYFEEISYFTNKINTIDIVKTGIQEIVEVTYGSSILLDVNSNYILDNDKKLKDICDLIDLGNLDISGTYIFTDLYKKIRERIEELK